MLPLLPHLVKNQDQKSLKVILPRLVYWKEPVDGGAVGLPREMHAKLSPEHAIDLIETVKSDDHKLDLLFKLLTTSADSETEL